MKPTADKQCSRNNNFLASPSPSDEMSLEKDFVPLDANGSSYISNWLIVRDQQEDKSDVSGGSPVDFSDDDNCLRRKSMLMSRTASEVPKTKVDDFTTGVSLQQSRMAGSRRVMNWTGEIGLLLPNIDNATLPNQPQENILSDIGELPSDLEKIQLEGLKNSPVLPLLSDYTLQPVIQAPPGGQFHSLLGCDGDAVSPPSSFHSFSSSPLQLSQCSDSCLESASQLRNSSPAGSYGSAGEPAEADRAVGMSGDLWSTSQVLQKREIAKRDFAEIGDDTQEFQGPPNKIPRLTDSTKRMASAAFPASGLQRNSGTDFRMAQWTSSPQGVEFSQQLPLQTTVQVPSPPSEQSAVPPGKACRPEIRNKLGQKIRKKRLEEGQGPLSINWDAKPQCELTPLELERIEHRKSRNRETARRTREKQKNTEKQLREAVKNTNEKLNNVNDEIAYLSKEMINLQSFLDSHIICRLRLDN